MGVKFYEGWEEKEAQRLYPKSRSKSKCSNSNLITVTHY